MAVDNSTGKVKIATNVSLVAKNDLEQSFTAAHLPPCRRPPAWASLPLRRADHPHPTCLRPRVPSQLWQDLGSPLQACLRPRGVEASGQGDHFHRGPDGGAEAFWTGVGAYLR